MKIKCIPYYGGSRMLLKVTAPFRVITNYVKHLAQLGPNILTLCN